MFTVPKPGTNLLRPLGLSTAPRIFTIVSQEESQIDWRAHSRILQCQSRPPQPSFTTYLRSSSKKRNAKSGDSVFINADSTPLEVDDINKVVISTLSKSGNDVSKFKSHSTRSAMASLLSNNVPFHVVKKMGRWKSNDTVDTFYDKKIIGEKSGGFLNTVVQL
ncbi:hypothetical protein ACTFIU_009036 [Dictyostelium citrinum]